MDVVDVLPPVRGGRRQCRQILTLAGAATAGLLSADLAYTGGHVGPAGLVLLTVAAGLTAAGLSIGTSESPAVLAANVLVGVVEEAECLR